MPSSAAKHALFHLITPMFRSVLIDKDSVLQAEGGYFTSVVTEVGSETSFRFEYQEHSISGDLLDNGTIRITPQPGQADVLEAAALDAPKVNSIVSAWWQSARADSVGS